MGGRRVVISELQSSLGECLRELKYGATLLMTDQGCQVSRTILSHGLARMTVAHTCGLRSAFFYSTSGTARPATSPTIP